jgi:arginine N-succinyltransferase
LAIIEPAGQQENAQGRDASPMLVSNTLIQDFRVLVVDAQPEQGRLALTEQQQSLLACGVGDPVRTMSVIPKRPVHA